MEEIYEKCSCISYIKMRISTSSYESILASRVTRSRPLGNAATCQLAGRVSNDPFGRMHWSDVNLFVRECGIKSDPARLCQVIDVSHFI